MPNIKYNRQKLCSFRALLKYAHVGVITNIDTQWNCASKLEEYNSSPYTSREFGSREWSEYLQYTSIPHYVSYSIHLSSLISMSSWLSFSVPAISNGERLGWDHKHRIQYSLCQSTGPHYLGYLEHRSPSLGEVMVEADSWRIGMANDSDLVGAGSIWSSTWIGA